MLYDIVMHVAHCQISLQQIFLPKFNSLYLLNTWIDQWSTENYGGQALLLFLYLIH